FHNDKPEHVPDSQPGSTDRSDGSEGRVTDHPQQHAPPSIAVAVAVVVSGAGCVRPARSSDRAQPQAHRYKRGSGQTDHRATTSITEKGASVGDTVDDTPAIPDRVDDGATSSDSVDARPGSGAAESANP